MTKKSIIRSVPGVGHCRFCTPLAISTALTLATCAVNAETVAWYHLDEIAPGQRLSADTTILNAVDSAKRSLVLIDNWATAEVLDLFSKKRKGVKVTIFTSEHYDKKHVPHRKISDDDVKTFNAQCQKLAVRYNESFHDRFLIIDDKELYLIGASLKDLGRKCFAFTKLDPAEIRRIKKTAFGRGENE